jgi:hypothetical protein
MKLAQHRSPTLFLFSTGAFMPRRTAPIKIATGTVTSAPVAFQTAAKDALTAAPAGADAAKAHYHDDRHTPSIHGGNEG